MTFWSFLKTVAMAKVEADNIQKIYPLFHQPDSFGIQTQYETCLVFLVSYVSKIFFLCCWPRHMSGKKYLSATKTDYFTIFGVKSQSVLSNKPLFLCTKKVPNSMLHVSPLVLHSFVLPLTILIHSIFKIMIPFYT